MDKQEQDTASVALTALTPPLAGRDNVSTLTSQRSVRLVLCTIVLNFVLAYGGTHTGEQ